MNTIEGKDRQKISKAMRQHGRINPQDREIPKTAAKVPVRFSEADQKKKKKKNRPTLFAPYVLSIAISTIFI